MTRNMELVREILLTIEKHPHGYAPEPLVIDGYDDETVGYHVFLMGQGELLDVLIGTAQGDLSPGAIATNMTWKGHEFHDTVKNDTVWKRVKAIVKSKGETISFEVLKMLATETAKTYFLQP
jgi:Hypothetical protein (DUF2513)